MQGFQHEAVTAKRHDDLGALRGDAGIKRGQLMKRSLRGVVFCGDDSNPGYRRNDHPPVTLI